jgi:hypothetical protein
MRRRFLAAVLCCGVTALSLAPTISPQYAPIVDSFVLPPPSSIAIDADLGSLSEAQRVAQPQP